MTTTRDAAIRVNIRTSAFASDVNSMVHKVSSAGKKMGDALRAPISAGLDSAKRSIADIGNGLKNTIRMAATLGGAISIGGAAKTAIEAETAYLRLSDALSTFSGQSYDAADAQALVERVADDTKVPIEGLRNSLLQLSSVSDRVDIESLLERSASQARRLGMEGEFVGRVYTRLVAKGVAQTAEEAENLTEQFNTLFRKMLGVDMDEAIDPADVAELSGFINTTGNNASEMLKLISLGGEKIAKDFGKANEIVEELGLSLRQTKGIDEMTKKLKLPKGAIDANKTALDNMLSVADLGPKKFKALADAMSGDIAGEAIKQIVGIEFFEKNVSKKQWDLRINELRGQLGDLGDLVVDRQNIEAADARHKKTTQAAIDHSMNILAKSFADKKMQKAISDLAVHLPDLAKAIADLVSFIAENPMKAMGIGLGAKVGGAAIAGVAGAALPAVGKALIGAGAAGAGAGAAGAATAAGGAAVAGGAAKGGLLATAGKGIVGGLAKLGAGAAGAGAGTAGAAMTAGAGILAAGAAGAAIGGIGRGIFLDPMVKKDFAALGESVETDISAAAALRGEDLAKKEQALTDVRKAIAELKKGPSWWTQFAGFASEFSEDVKSPWELQEAKMTPLLKKEKKLEDDWVKSLWNKESKPAKSVNEFGIALDRVTQSLERLEPKSLNTTRGPATAPPSKPGYESGK